MKFTRQVLRMNRENGGLAARAISHVVLMGAGEPLTNYDNTLGFLRMATDEAGLGLSIRNISVSTCGIVPKMYALADSGYTPTLCVSLHAPDDLVRKKIMPTANTFAMEEILKAAAYYFQKTGRRIIIDMR